MCVGMGGALVCMDTTKQKNRHTCMITTCVHGLIAPLTHKQKHTHTHTHTHTHACMSHSHTHTHTHAFSIPHASVVLRMLPRRRPLRLCMLQLSENNCKHHRRSVELASVRLWTPELMPIITLMLSSSWNVQWLPGLRRDSSHERMA